MARTEHQNALALSQPRLGRRAGGIEQGLAADEEKRFKTLYKVYAERIRAFQITPPPDDWNGAYALESK